MQLRGGDGLRKPKYLMRGKVLLSATGNRLMVKGGVGRRRIGGVAAGVKVQETGVTGVPETAVIAGREAIVAAGMAAKEASAVEEKFP